MNGMSYATSGSRRTATWSASAERHRSVHTRVALPNPSDDGPPAPRPYDDPRRADMAGTSVCANAGAARRGAPAVPPLGPSIVAHRARRQRERHDASPRDRYGELERRSSRAPRASPDTGLTVPARSHVRGFIDGGRAGALAPRRLGCCQPRRAAPRRPLRLPRLHGSRVCRSWTGGRLALRSGAPPAGAAGLLGIGSLSESFHRRSQDHLGTEPPPALAHLRSRVVAHE